MIFGDRPSPDPDDFFAETRMSFGDHIEELRTRMIRAILGFVVALVAGLFLSPLALRFISHPVERALMQVYQRRLNVLQAKIEAGDKATEQFNQPRDEVIEVHLATLAEALGLPAAGEGKPDYVALPVRVRPFDTYLDGKKLDLQVGRKPSLAAFNVTETFLVYLKVAMGIGVVLASPWIFYQMWMFVAAGLYPHEKRYVHLVLPISLGLFLAGVFLCQFVVLPIGVDYLLSFNEWLDVDTELRLNDWLSFAILMPLLFGIAFQTPLVMFFLDRVGLVTVETFRRQRRMAIFLLALGAALLSVSPDAVSMMSLAVPMWALYELGIVMCRFWPRPAWDTEESEEAEAVEV